MGMFDSIRNFFKGSNTVSVAEQDDSYEKSILVGQIVNLIDKIKRINCFDSSIWNLSNVSDYDLKNRKSLDELKIIHSKLKCRLSELSRQSQTVDSRREELEASKWTGQRPNHMTDYEFDRFQRDESR